MKMYGIHSKESEIYDLTRIFILQISAELFLMIDNKDSVGLKSSVYLDFTHSKERNMHLFLIKKNSLNKLF